MVREQVRRRKRSVWPWLVGLAVLIAALWAVAWILEPGEEIPDPSRLSTDGVEAPDPVLVPPPANE